MNERSVSMPQQSIILRAETYQCVDVNQDTSLRVLRRKRITIDSNPPSLIHSRLTITRHAVGHGCKLGAEEEDVNTAKDRNAVESFGDGVLEPAMIQITDKIAVDIDRSAALIDGQTGVTGLGGNRKRIGTYKRYGSVVINGLAAFVYEIRRTRQANGNDLLALAVIRVRSPNVCLDRQRASGQVSTEPAKRAEAFGVGGQLVDADIVRGVCRVRPAKDGVGGGMENILGVWAGKVRRERDVEGAVNRGIGGMRRA